MIRSAHRANDALTNLDDKSLAAELSMGHHDALAVLFNRHGKIVFRVSRRILGDDGEAEETVQEVFMEAYERISQFDAQKGSLRNWLMAIGRYRAIDRKRRLQSSGVYRSIPMSEESTDSFLPAKSLPRFSPHELPHLLTELLKVLSPEEKRVIDLHLLRDLTLEETRIETKFPISAVRHLYYRAMKKLRTALFAKPTDPPKEGILSRKAGRDGTS
jgi:RNA polymerase sigma-70 factor (ECF subfamily)